MKKKSKKLKKPKKQKYMTITQLELQEYLAAVEIFVADLKQYVEEHQEETVDIGSNPLPPPPPPPGT